MKKFLIGIVILIAVVIGIVAYLLGNVNDIVKQAIETIGPEVLQASVKVDSVNISPTDGTGEINGLVIGNPAGYKSKYAFRLAKVRIALDIQSLTTDKVHIKSVLIDSPEILLEGSLSKNNLLQLQQNALSFANSISGGKKSSNGGDKNASKGAEKKMLIDTVKIEKGKAGVSLDLLKGKPLHISLPTIELNDIGKKKEKSIAEALSEIFASINKSLFPSVQSAANDVLKEVKKVGEKIQKEIKENLPGKAKEQLNSILNNVLGD